MAAGDGLRRPLNAPPPGLVTPGVQPGTTNAVSRAVTVIVSGPTGAIVGVFVYQPGTTPGPGNAPIDWLTGGTVDPYGNVLPSSGSGSQGSGSWSALEGGEVWVNGLNIYGNASIGTGGAIGVGAAVLTAGYPGGAAFETWHDMTLLNGWTNTAGFTARYKLMPDNSVWIQGGITAGTTADATQLWQFPAGYIPANRQGIKLIAQNQTSAPGNTPPWLDVNAPTGFLLFRQSSLGGATEFIFNDRYTLD